MIFHFNNYNESFRKFLCRRKVSFRNAIFVFIIFRNFNFTQSLALLLRVLVQAVICDWDDERGEWKCRTYNSNNNNNLIYAIFELSFDASQLRTAYAKKEAVHCVFGAAQRRGGVGVEFSCEQRKDEALFWRGNLDAWAMGVGGVDK